MTLSKPRVDVLDKGYVILQDHMGSDLSVVNSARVSYNKATSELRPQDIKLIHFLANGDHTSPFRHASLTFEVYSPLLVARQHWKYAVASSHLDDQNGWNESSRRYVTETPEFYIPTENEWRSAPANSKQGSGLPVPSEVGRKYTRLLMERIDQSVQDYERAMQDGICTEQARMFLLAYPMLVRYYWTTSLAGMIHFLQQRVAHDAQVEIQAYAKAVHKLAVPLFPVAMDAMGVGEDLAEL